MSTKQADINGITINYRDTGGDKPPILFCHGFLMDHTMFDAQIDVLSGDYRCITWDERGFGDTNADSPFDYWDSANDAVGLLDHLGIEQAVFVGMSQGGFLSLRAALAHPDRVGAVVLIDSCADTDDAETIEGYRQMLAGIHSGDDATVDAVTQTVAQLILGDPELTETWVGVWKDRLAAGHTLHHPGAALLDRDDISARVGEISCPVLVIHGGADHAITLDRAQAVADAVVDCRDVVVVDGAAHAPNMSHPGPVNEALSGFLTDLRA